MRKMTKTALVLAAMSAMTVASASMAFAAAGNRENVTSKPTESNPTAETGTWTQDKFGWKFKGDEQFKNTWANIDGIWYYFKDDGYMAQDELVEIDDKLYHFLDNGYMHAGGWAAFEQDGDVLNAYGLDMNEYYDDIMNPLKDRNDPYETVYMYFDEHGEALEDKWYNDGTGRYYYFDGPVMVCGDYDHIIGDDIYGFAHDGHMYYGWEKAYVDNSVLAPNDDDQVYYYYGEGGKKYLGTDDWETTHGQGYAWRKIAGKWYLFADEMNGDFSVNATHPGTIFGASRGTLVTKAYISNTKMGAGNGSYYYLDSNGVLAQGKKVVEVDNTARYVTDTWAVGVALGKDHTNNKIEIYVDGDGIAKTGWQGSNYFGNSATVTTVEEHDSTSVTDVPVAYDFKANDVYGQMIRRAFVWDGSYLKYVDKYGDRVDNTKMLVGYVSATVSVADVNDLKAVRDEVNAGDITTSVTSVNWGAKGSQVGRYNVYILMDKDGKIYTDANATTAGNKVRVGNANYIATNDYITICGQNAQLFVYPNENNK